MSWSPTASAWIGLVGLKGAVVSGEDDILYKYLILFRRASQLQAGQTHFKTFVFTCDVTFVICFACDFICSLLQDSVFFSKG